MVVKKHTITISMLFIFNMMIHSQTLLSHTFTNVGLGFSGKFNMLNSIGETFVGQKNIKNHIIIEGFYGYNLLKIDSISYQLAKCRIFPNPAKEKFVVFNENNNFNLKLEIYNTSGLKIKSYIVSANSVLNVNSLQTGVYVIKLSELEKINEKPIIIKQIIIN